MMKTKQKTRILSLLLTLTLLLGMLPTAAFAGEDDSSVSSGESITDEGEGLSDESTR